MWLQSNVFCNRKLYQCGIIGELLYVSKLLKQGAPKMLPFADKIGVSQYYLMLPSA